jgi:carboxypeptidase family protein
MNAWILVYIWPSSAASKKSRNIAAEKRKKKRKMNQNSMIPRLSFRHASLLGCALLLVISLSSAALAQKNQQQGRLLSGKVLDAQDNPVVSAIVYLTNTRTHAVKTYIVGQDGTYRFPGLSNVDFEVYAQFKNHKSDTKSVSQFDDRSQVYIDLRVDTR